MLPSVGLLGPRNRSRSRWFLSSHLRCLCQVVRRYMVCPHDRIWRYLQWYRPWHWPGWVLYLFQRHVCWIHRSFQISVSGFLFHLPFPQTFQERIHWHSPHHCGETQWRCSCWSVRMCRQNHRMPCWVCQAKVLAPHRFRSRSDRKELPQELPWWRCTPRSIPLSYALLPYWHSLREVVHWLSSW